MADLAQLEQAYASLQTVFRTQIAPAFDALKARVAAGATLDEVQGEIDRVRAEFDNAYARLEEFVAEARTIQPLPTEFIARLENSLNVNRPTNYQALGRVTTDAGQNTNKRAAETAAKAAADQGPGTASAADAVGDASVQNPAVTSDAAVVPSNADPAVAPPADPGVAPPKIPGAATGSPSGTVSTTSIQAPQAGTGVSALQGSEINTTTSSYIFKATHVISRFTRGQFTQELEGVLMLFPDQFTANSAPNSAQAQDVRGSSVATVTGSTATQSQARQVDNQIDAARPTPNQSAAESTRLAQAGQTPNQSSAESARLLAQAGRAAETISSGQIPVGSLNTVSTALTAARGGDTAASLGSLARLTGASPAGASLVQAGVSLLPADVFPATSLGQAVGVTSGAAGRGGASGASRPTTTAITIPTREGGEITVSTAQQVQALAAQGIISNATRDSALTQLASLTAAQQPQTSVDRQAVTKDN